MSTWSTLKIELIGSGEQAGTWGTTTNNNLGSDVSGSRGLEQAIAGMATLETADFTSNVYTLSYNDSNAAQDFRALVLNITATLSAAGEVIVPAIQKPYIVLNNSVGGYAVTVKVSGQTGVSVPNGAKVLVYNNGTDIGAAITYLTSLSLGSPLPTASGGTGSTSTQFVNLTTNVTGVLPVANGGTNNGFFTVSGPATTAKTYTFANENMTLVGTTQTQTLTNKTITRRVSSTTSITSPLAWNSDNFDIYAATAQANDFTINDDTGTPTDGRSVVFRITCDGSARTITFTGGVSKSFIPIGVSLTSTGSDFTYVLSPNKTTYFGCAYNSSSSRWEIIALSQEV